MSLVVVLFSSSVIKQGFQRKVQVAERSIPHQKMITANQKGASLFRGPFCTINLFQ
jgi:hypothetical protein